MYLSPNLQVLQQLTLTRGEHCQMSNWDRYAMNGYHLRIGRKSQRKIYISVEGT